MEPQIFQPNQGASASQPTSAVQQPQSATVQNVQAVADGSVTNAAVYSSPAVSAPSTIYTQPSGQELFASDQPVSNSADTAVANRKSKRPLIAALSGVAILFIVAVGGYHVYGNLSRANATKQAQAFVNSLNKGDNTLAYSMTSAALKKGQTEQQFADSLGDLQTSQPGLAKQTTTVQGKDATYIGFEDGLPADANGSTNGSFTINLVKSGLTSWKVDSVNVQ